MAVVCQTDHEGKNKTLAIIDTRGKITGTLEKNAQLEDKVKPASQGLICVELKNGFSFIDKTGRPICSRRFVNAINFSEGLAAAKPRDKWGFIDKTGRFVIKPKYDEACPFSENLALVKDSNGQYFIDHRGRVAIHAP